MAEALTTELGMDALKGTVLFRQGDAGGSLYVIRSGRVQIRRRFGDERRVIATLGPGEFFGEMSVVSGRPRSATAEVVEDATFLKIRAEKLEALIAKHPEIAIRLIRKLADRIEVSNRMFEALLHDDPSEKVIVALRHAMEVNESPDGSMPIHLGTLSGQLGLSVQQTDNVIKRLVRVGVLQRTDAGLKIADLGRLDEFVEFIRTSTQAADGV